MNVSHETTSPQSAERCAENVEMADNNDLSALNCGQAALRREFVRGGMMLYHSVNHKETRLHSQKNRINPIFFSAD